MTKSMMIKKYVSIDHKEIMKLLQTSWCTKSVENAAYLEVPQRA